MDENLRNSLSLAQSPEISHLIGKDVVLDTAGTITFLGRLVKIEPQIFVLENADIRDGREGHVTKDKYVCDAQAHGIQPNRQRLMVVASAIISISALDDIVSE